MPQDRICLFFVGTAGSGKSTLVASFSRWMKDNSYDAVSVNLDPGAESIPYIHDFDIREKINLRTIMS
ncbi:MAG: ATP/GTP-binding protein, partial [Thermoplasmata archaeon]